MTETPVVVAEPVSEPAATPFDLFAQPQTEPIATLTPGDTTYTGALVAGTNQVPVAEIAGIIPGQYLQWHDGSGELEMEIGAVIAASPHALEGPGTLTMKGNLTRAHAWPLAPDSTIVPRVVAYAPSLLRKALDELERVVGDITRLTGSLSLEHATALSDAAAAVSVAAAPHVDAAPPIPIAAADTAADALESDADWTAVSEHAQATLAADEAKVAADKATLATDEATPHAAA